MKKHRIWVQYIVDGDIEGTLEVGTDDEKWGKTLWSYVKFMKGTTGNPDKFWEKNHLLEEKAN